MRVPVLLTMMSLGLSAALVLPLLAETPAPATSPTGAPTTAPAKEFAPLNIPSLHNAHRVTDKLISGAQPDGEESFIALKELGVKTIISVDGATPDVEMAHKYGMKYVHLPMRYDGVERQQGFAVAKAIETMPGPIYLHCHHGKHRSAAAVAVACVYGGMLPPSKAEAVLQTFGTGLNYKGLWAAAREAKPSQADVDALQIEFVETKKIPPLAETMVHIDATNDNLKALQKNNWKQLPNHPDLDAAHEALQMEEHYHELIRANAGKDHPADFTEMLKKAEQAAITLKTALKANDFATANDANKLLGTSCTDCHKVYRD